MRYIWQTNKYGRNCRKKLKLPREKRRKRRQGKLKSEGDTVHERKREWEKNRKEEERGLTARSETTTERKQEEGIIRQKGKWGETQSELRQVSQFWVLDSLFASSWLLVWQFFHFSLLAVKRCLKVIILDDSGVCGSAFSLNFALLIVRLLFSFFFTFFLSIHIRFFIYCPLARARHL